MPPTSSPRTTLVAFIRALNVAGHNVLSMADLKAFLADAGCERPRTLLQSGNALFETRPTVAARAWERRLEEAAAAELSLRVHVLIRTAPQLAATVAANPFPEQAVRDPARLLVMFLKGTPKASAVEALRRAIPGGEQIHAEGPQLYISYPDGIGRSTLTGALIERTLATRGTARNWNTLRKLLALAQRERTPA